jgi:hypothetical protein
MTTRLRGGLLRISRDWSKDKIEMPLDGFPLFRSWSGAVQLGEALEPVAELVGSEPIFAFAHDRQVTPPA